MKKSHLFIATLTSITIVGGISSKTLLQPLPPPPPQLQESSSPPNKQNEKPSLPNKEPSLPSGELSLPNQEALLDAAANLVIEKFQNASCEELSTMTAKSDNNSQAGGEQQAAIHEKAIAMLEKNPEIREEFLNRVAAPIANKMFDCNFIP
ncbi:MAG: hypothetical protein F6K47_26735 [Symploca sp. SIO2E6]|nr:hypothetical protein [Symploca sp. SIO2E6]